MTYNRGYGRGLDIDGKHCGNPNCSICNNPRGPRPNRGEWDEIERNIRYESRSREEYETRLGYAQMIYAEQINNSSNSSQAEWYEIERYAKITYAEQINNIKSDFLLPGEEILPFSEAITNGWSKSPTKPKKTTLGNKKSKYKDDGFLESLLSANQPNQEEVNETVKLDGFQSLLKAND